MQRGTPFLVHSNSTTHGGLGNTGKTGHVWGIFIFRTEFHFILFYFPEGTI